MIMVRLREIREAKGLSREQLSRLSNVSANMIYHIETGRKNPTIKLLLKLSKALDVEISDLIAEDTAKTEV